MLAVARGLESDSGSLKAEAKTPRHHSRVCAKRKEGDSEKAAR